MRQKYTDLKIGDTLLTRGISYEVIAYRPPLHGELYIPTGGRNGGHVWAYGDVNYSHSKNEPRFVVIVSNPIVPENPA